jgi:hypothetical protein
MLRSQPIIVRLTTHQALRCEKLATYLWPEERLDVGEISRRLLLEHLLWAESERNLVESVWGLKKRCPLRVS